MMKTRIALAAACAALTACGGGGGEPEPNPVLLNSNNYVDALREAIAPVNFLFEPSSLILGVEVSGDNAIFKLAKAQLAKMPERFSKASGQVTGVTQTEVEQCDNVGGTLTVASNDQNGNEQIDPGDSATFTASNCLLGGSLLNGDFSLVIDSISGVFLVPPYAFSSTFTLNNLSAQTGNVIEAATGNFTLGANWNTADFGSVSMTAPQLAMTSNDGIQLRSRSVSNYSVLQSVAAGTAEITVNGSVSASWLTSNPLTIATEIPFTVIGDSDPMSGRAVVSAQRGGKVRLTAPTAGSALVELDANDDGTYENFVSLPWNEI